jgi:FHS family L-fucose permease-like MFS transporter
MNKTKSYIYPLSIIALLFFVFGFLTSVNGILIPYFQICLQLNNFQASLVAFAAFIAYFIMALPAAQVLKITGYKKGMVLGLIIMAVGTALFIPAARSRTYAIFLTGLFITGAGLTLLQTAVNPYVAIIGPIKSTAQRIGFMGLANKIAGILSISVLGSIFLFNADTVVARVKTLHGAQQTNILDSYSLKIATPYLIITLVLLFLAFMIYVSGMPEIDDAVKNDGETEIKINHKRNIFHYPYLVMGVLVLFFSNACEGIPVDGIILYGRSLGIPIEVARHFTTYTLCAMLAGYLASTVLIPKYLSQHNALLLCSIYGLILSVIAYFSSSFISMYCLVLMGVGSAMFWGTIWGLSIRELGKYTKIGSAMLLMSVIGGGIFPLIFGRLIDANLLHPQNSLLLLIPCYCVLLFFSGWGYRVESWRLAPLSKKLNDLSK